MKALYNAVLNQLVTKVPELKMIDFDLGQLAQLELPSLNYPAALIRIDINDLVDLGQRLQQGTAIISITLVFRTFERTHSIATAEFRAKGLEHLDIIDKVKWAIHSLAGATFSPINHRATTSADRVELRAYPMIFDTLIYENPPADQVTHVPWTEAGGVAPGPDICLEDENQNLLS